MPLAIVWLALVELVKVAKVPRPAIAAATPRMAMDATILWGESLITFTLSSMATAATSPKKGLSGVNRGSS